MTSSIGQCISQIEPELNYFQVSVRFNKRNIALWILAPSVAFERYRSVHNFLYWTEYLFMSGTQFLADYMSVPLNHIVCLCVTDWSPVTSGPPHWEGNTSGYTGEWQCGWPWSMVVSVFDSRPKVLGSISHCSQSTCRPPWASWPLTPTGPLRTFWCSR